MPEGHTIHKIANDHSKLLAGETLAVSSPQGPFAADAERVDGAVLEKIFPYGKHLFYEWSTGDVGHVHLGLFGKYTVYETEDPPEPKGAVRMRLTAPNATIDLNGPTICTIDEPESREKILARLGPDPIHRNSRPDAMFAKIERSKRSIGELLMDQSVVAGIGNVYRAEILFTLGLHPLQPGKDLDRTELEAIWATAQRMLRAGVKAGRIVTVARDESGVPRGKRIPRSEATYAYKRDHCLRCGTEISMADMANRTVYWCPTCQQR